MSKRAPTSTGTPSVENGSVPERSVPRLKRQYRPAGAYWCQVCGNWSDTTGREQPYCRDCLVELHKANGTKPPPSLASLSLEARVKRYGISMGRYQLLLTRQNNACAICKREPTDSDGLLIDHNHATGEVRGLLCGACNTALGLFQDSPDVLDVALQYLEERGCYGPNALAEENQ